MLFRIHHSWLLILASLGPVTTGFAALNLSQNTPYEFGGDVRLETTLGNDTGVTLDSATLDYSSVLFDVANLSWNITRFDQNSDNVVDFINDDLVTQLSPYLVFSVVSTGDVSTGWAGVMGSDGVVDLAHGPSYTPFSDNQEMDTRLILGNYLVEDPATSTIVPITLSTTETITDFATATEGPSAVPFTADGFTYSVVPEPASFGWLLGLTTLWLTASRRRL